MVVVYVDDADITLLAGKTESDLDRGTALHGNSISGELI